MNKKLRTSGLVLMLIGLIFIFFGLLFSKRFFLFDYTYLLNNSKSVMIFGLILFVLGAVFRITGILLKEKLQPEIVQKEEDVYTGTCPVCHKEFNVNPELKNGYYVFSCNNCNSKLRVKKSTYYPAG